LGEPLSPCPRRQVCVDGTALSFGIEGAFWAIRGDDSVSYDPVGGTGLDDRRAEGAEFGDIGCVFGTLRVDVRTQLP